MKASVYIATSLDGFIARNNGSLDWLPGSDGNHENNSEDYGFQKFMDSVDVLVMGRKTYEMVLSFGQWPYGTKRVVVLSKTLAQISETLPQTVELKSASPAELFQELRTSGAKHIYVDGGSTIQGFLRAGLIHEITITRVPVLIGSGIPLFGAIEKDLPLKHIETRSFDSGFVQSRYALPTKR
ncbi:MAG: dihydrofolate reductase [SAR324 cluster bacterium]|nr:dihydrofolate reductase [SAR324 cluster bacterium]MBF0351363.1 dihydrofolate reductase [SAR324 cluster bacterium]